MRILYSHRVQSRDGQSVHIEELVMALRQAGHEVLVAGPSFYKKVGFGGESRFVPMIRKVLPKLFAEIGELFYNVPAFLRLWHAYRRFLPDFVYERYNLYHLSGMLLKRLCGIPFYLEINSPLAEERSLFGGLRLRRLARNVERLIWRSADRIFVVTTVLGNIVAAAGVPSARITVIPNGVERHAFPPQHYKAQPGRPVIIGFVGFVREWHGLEEVIDGLATRPADPAIQLVIVGPVSPDLEQQAQALGVADLVQFTGLEQRTAIPHVLRTFDIALQPRAVSYASPLKLFEYMACSRAIIAPDQRNIREILTNRENAILFDPDAPGSLWRAIRHLAVDPELRERLGRAARSILDERDYTWQGNAGRIVESVASDLGQRGPVVNAALPLDRSVPHG